MEKSCPVDAFFERIKKVAKSEAQPGSFMWVYRIPNKPFVVQVEKCPSGNGVRWIQFDFMEILTDDDIKERMRTFNQQIELCRINQKESENE